jgi:hypothetical protein
MDRAALDNRLSGDQPVPTGGGLANRVSRSRSTTGFRAGRRMDGNPARR